MNILIIKYRNEELYLYYDINGTCMFIIKCDERYEKHMIIELDDKIKYKICNFKLLKLTNKKNHIFNKIIHK
jgi:hypothetical protein